MWEAITTDSCDVCQCPSRPKKASASHKGNLAQALSPVKNEDLSFYGSTSPVRPICTGTSPNHCNHNIIIRRPLEDYDVNSRDSGFVTNDDGRFSSFASPPRDSFESASIGSVEDDLFFEDFSYVENLEENLPQDFNKLINAPIARNNRTVSPRDSVIRPLFRRALSLQNERTPSKARTCLFMAVESRAFKRPEAPEQSPTSSKKQKMQDEGRYVPVLERSISATEESIMRAVDRAEEEPDLIGDFSRSFCLPLTPGRHQDLKSITPSTLAKLIKGDFSGHIASFKVIDCRYPYEYEGGHIDGAINVYTKDQCMELLKSCASAQKCDQERSNILVFHCEFSSERGPNLYRYLREQDRKMNRDTYPSLHYPEVYLLEGGYKNFFEKFSDLCVPIAYTEMLHPSHEKELRYFRLKSKTWNADCRQRSQSRKSLNRLGL